MLVLHAFRDSERDAGGGGWFAHKWQFQRDVIIGQHHMDVGNEHLYIGVLI